MSNHTLSLILERLKQITACQTDSALSRALGISPQTLSSWKVRESVPYALCVDLATRHDISLDWLLLGKQTRPMIASPTDVLSGADDDLALGLLERLRLLEPADLHAIASSVDDKLRLRQLERQLETLQRSHEA
ncbi:bacteriophage CI repressor [Pseudomonas entomophila]|uniref:helix-turn-helix domain-containing protein n=1 Tax=Pseudomonas entomophila TaxID=312306 RepID=UPI0015E322F0|nr:helix-turn-helix domain-containing protein [Pseudomonas entomophila]MBA1191484.1 bacteriophage CI repressor [Pseudomonas entomophila]